MSFLTSDTVFVGRDKEIGDLLGRLNNKANSITLLTGESGIGKSKFLDEIYRRLRYESQDRLFFVGYYDKNNALISESETPIYPFSIILESLVKTAKESQQLAGRIDNTVARVKRGLVKFAKTKESRSE
jgi:predicted ATPase